MVILLTLNNSKKNINNHFSNFEQDKKINNYFANFEHVKKIKCHLC